jgi:hypothetical protein
MQERSIVRFLGGPASGAVVEVPTERVEALHPGHVSVSPAGLLYDRNAGRYVQGAVVIVNPHDPDQAD